MFRQTIRFLSETPASIEANNKANKLLQQAKQESDQDDIKTINLYAQAAKLGNTEALQILESAASNGNMRALHHLGNMYINGYGVERNRNKGDEFILKLPESEALHAKGIAYANAVRRLRSMRDNLELDRIKLSVYDYRSTQANILNKSKEYFEQAIEALNKLNKLPESSTNNHANNLCLLGNIYVDFFEINQASVGDQTIELLKQAKDYFEQATKQGNAEASFHIGVLYEKGGKFAKAAEAYLEAHRMGYENALTALKNILPFFGSNEVTYFHGLAEENKETWFRGLPNADPKTVLQRIEDHYLHREISDLEADILLKDFHTKHIKPYKAQSPEKNHYHWILAKLHLDQQNIEEAKQNIGKITAVLAEELSKATKLATSSEDNCKNDSAVPSETRSTQGIVSSAETADKIAYFAGLSEDHLVQLGLWCMNLYDDSQEMNDQAKKAFEAAQKINPNCERAKTNLELLKSRDNIIEESSSQRISNLLTKLRKLLPQMGLQQSALEKLSNSFSDLQYYFLREQKEDIKESYNQLITDISQSGLDEKIIDLLINILNSLFIKKESSHEKEKEKEKKIGADETMLPLPTDSDIAVISLQISELTNIVENLETDTSLTQATLSGSTNNFVQSSATKPSDVEQNQINTVAKEKFVSDKQEKIGFSLRACANSLFFIAQEKFSHLQGKTLESGVNNQAKPKSLQ